MARKNNNLSANPKLGIIEVKAKMACGGWLCSLTVGKVSYPDYQRDEQIGHVDKITGRFDPRKAMPLLVSLRQGKLNCMNGRQTAAVLRNVEQDTWDAIVYTDLTYEDEADMFFDFNDTPKKVGGWHKFFAKSRSKQGQANREILAVVKSHNLTTPLDLDIDKRKNADITSSRVLVEAMKLGGSPLVDKLCTVLAKCWKQNGVVAEDAKQIDLLRGLCKHLQSDGVPFASTVLILKHISARKVREIANTMKSKGRIDASQVRQALCQLCTVVNKAA
jgi:hypothetical protein